MYNVLGKMNPYEYVVLYITLQMSALKMNNTNVPINNSMIRVQCLHTNDHSHQISQCNVYAVF